MQGTEVTWHVCRTWEIQDPSPIIFDNKLDASFPVYVYHLLWWCTKPMLGLNTWYCRTAHSRSRRVEAARWVRQMPGGCFIGRILLITWEWTGHSRERNRCREWEVDSHGNHSVRKSPQPEAIDWFFKVLLD